MDRAAVAYKIYDLIVSSRQDPLVWLCICWREHQFGTDTNSVLWRNHTHSWTNARSVRLQGTLGYQIVIDPVRKSPYVVYRNVVDSVMDGLFRVTEPGYAYQQHHCVSIHDYISIWTEDGAEDYCASISQSSAVFTQGDQVVSVPSIDISTFVPPVIKQQWFQPNGVSYLGEDMDLWGVCIHETGNTGAYAEAQQNVNYMNSPECIARQASWHATVGLKEIIETIPDNKQAYHASDGDGPGNTHFKAIEGVMCYPVNTPEFNTVLRNHAWYAARSLRLHNLPFNLSGAFLSGGRSVAQHNTFARDNKDCPAFYRDNNLWGYFTDTMYAFYDRNEWAAAVGNPWFFKETNKWIADPGFQDFFLLKHIIPNGCTRDQALTIWGYPTSGSFYEKQPDGKTLLVQYFQRNVFMNFGDRVETRLLGYEDLQEVWPNGAPA